MTAPRIGLLHGGASYHLVTLADPVVARHVTDPLYLPDLADPENADPEHPDGARALTELDALVVADRLHPELVVRCAPALLAAAARGTRLVVLGEVDAHAWLPGAEWTPRPTNFWWWRTGEDPGIRVHHPEHPIWAHLGAGDVTWHHHGVLHPPPGAVSLATVDEGGERIGTILYTDDVSTAGGLVVTTMDPVHHHGSNFMPAATRLLHGLLGWLADDLAPAPCGPVDA